MNAKNISDNLTLQKLKMQNLNKQLSSLEGTDIEKAIFKPKNTIAILIALAVIIVVVLAFTVFKKGTLDSSADGSKCYDDTSGGIGNFCGGIGNFCNKICG